MIRYWCVLVQYGAVDRCWMLHHVAASFNALSVLSPTDLPFAISILHAVGEETARPASEGLPEVSTCCRHLFVGHRICLHDFQSPNLSKIILRALKEQVYTVFWPVHSTVHIPKLLANLIQLLRGITTIERMNISNS